MAKGKTGSAGDKARYTKYQNLAQYSKNKKRKLERHLKKYPNDTVAENCLKNGAKGFSYSRSTPKTRTPLNSSANKKFAHLLRITTGTGSRLSEYLKLERTVYG